MSSPWRVVDLTGYAGTVSANHGFLHVEGSDVALIDIVTILTGVDGAYHPSVFERCAHFQIPMLHCDWRGIPISATHPWSNGSRIAARHRAQAALALPRSKNAWMQIIRSKVLGQARVLEEFARPEANGLRDLAALIRSGDPANVEGQAARAYWQALSSSPSFRRRARTREGINAFLDYGYTILRGRAIRSVLEAGLWPTLGIWHHQRDNVFALADDLVEPFRPAIDAFVFPLAVQAEQLDPTLKRAIVSAVDQRFEKSGSTVESSLKKLAHSFAIYVEGATQKLKVPVYEGLRED